MSATVVSSKGAPPNRGGASDEGATARRPTYNIALVCGNSVQIFTPERFHELPIEVGRLLAWGNELHDIDLQLLESDTAFH